MTHRSLGEVSDPNYSGRVHVRFLLSLLAKGLLEHTWKAIQVTATPTATKLITKRATLESLGNFQLMDSKEMRGIGQSNFCYQ